MPSPNTRTEHDFLGDLAAADAYNGVPTVRALENFANPEVGKHYLNSSIGTVTALNLVIGYDRSTELAAEARRTGEGILELIRQKHILTAAQIDEILNPAALTGQGR
jgi:aspartate ammonia-lyase